MGDAIASLRPVVGEPRQGDWMETASGKRFWPLDPRPGEIDIEDIATALSHICRFGGHVCRFYSVAQHSVLVSYHCDLQDALWGLLHDASEAYLGDMVRPLKRHEDLLPFRQAEDRLQAAICARFGLTWPMPTSVHRADEILLATEARDIKCSPSLERWSSLDGIEPLARRFAPWGPREARAHFLQRFRDLTEEW